MPNERFAADAAQQKSQKSQRMILVGNPAGFEQHLKPICIDWSENRFIASPDPIIV